ncbi:MAG: hypothetical protein P1R58_10030 [bacterium]|nr:hypothetical protein [bacterium]
MFRSKVLMFALIVCFGWSASTLTAADKETKKTEVKETASTKVETTTSSSTRMAELKAKLEAAAAKTGASPRTGEQINWQVISGGATNGSSTNFSLMGTVGQTAVGTGGSTNYDVRHGFWQSFAGSGTCCNVPGDFNDDSSVDITDLTAMVDFMFAGGSAAPCPDEADVDASCGIDISDLTYRVDFMFAGGPAPVCGCVGP